MTVAIVRKVLEIMKFVWYLGTVPREQWGGVVAVVVKVLHRFVVIGENHIGVRQRRRGWLRPIRYSRIKGILPMIGCSRGCHLIL